MKKSYTNLTKLCANKQDKSPPSSKYNYPDQMKSLTDGVAGELFSKDVLSQIDEKDLLLSGNVYSHKSSYLQWFLGHDDQAWRAVGLQILAMNMTQKEKEHMAFSGWTATWFTNQGNDWKTTGDRLYTVQIISATLVPVLIGVMNSFDEGEFLGKKISVWIQIAAIILSILGSIAKAVEDVYQYRQRGHVRYSYGQQMWKLFYDFYSLTGPVFDANHITPGLEAEHRDEGEGLHIPDLSHIPRDILKAVVAELDRNDAQEMEKAENASKHSGENFKLYITHHQKMSQEARTNAFAGQAARGSA